jgi:hypothetical protein
VRTAAGLQRIAVEKRLSHAARAPSVIWRSLARLIGHRPLRRSGRTPSGCWGEQQGNGRRPSQGSYCVAAGSLRFVHQCVSGVDQLLKLVLDTHSVLRLPGHRTQADGDGVATLFDVLADSLRERGDVRRVG